jgi:hypothetical protein
MKKILFIASLLVSTMLFGQQPQENYPEDSASMLQKGVPRGEILKFSFSQSKIFPGTSRDCWVYVPAQYDPANRLRIR